MDSLLLIGPLKLTAGQILSIVVHLWLLLDELWCLLDGGISSRGCLGQGTGGNRDHQTCSAQGCLGQGTGGTEIIKPVQHKAVWDRVLAGPRSLDDGERGPLYVTMHYHHQNQSAFRWATMTCFFEVSTHNVGQRKKVFMTVFIAQQ